MFNKKNKNFSLSYFKNDFSAGLVVWLVALPLCIGIAKGSEVNAFSGLIAGIIGGLIVTFFSGSKFGVSGPAAGLITIVVAGIATLEGDLSTFFLAVFLSGIIQFLFGLFRLGVIGYFVPTSVINGMLASIGLTLILKQIPLIFGGFSGSSVHKDVYSSFMDSNGIENTHDIHLLVKIWLDTQAAINSISFGALIIFGISILIMILWEQKFIKNIKFFQFLPASLMVVIIGAALAYCFNSFGGDSGSSLALVKQQLVGLPTALKEWDFKNLITLPNFSGLTNPNVWIIAVTIAIVGSIETLLSVEATDKLDPDKNISPTNKELKAQGIGNAISGLIGGLPITMVIVRSSANINAKAKTQLSAIYHGLFLLISVFTFPHLLELIPSASLAAILCVLGFKLLKLNTLFKMFKTDPQSSLVILVTIAAVLATDLLKGVGIGFALAMFFILRKNYELALISHTDEKENETVISFAQIVSFLNKGALMQTLQKIPNGSKVKMSAIKCHTMSKEIQEVIVDFRDISSKINNIDLELIGFEKFDFISSKKT